MSVFCGDDLTKACNQAGIVVRGKVRSTQEHKMGDVGKLYGFRWREIGFQAAYEVYEVRTEKGIKWFPYRNEDERVIALSQAKRFRDRKNNEGGMK